MATKIPDGVRRYMQEIGAKGGKAGREANRGRAHRESQGRGRGQVEEEAGQQEAPVIS